MNVCPRTLDHIHVASLPLNVSTKDYLWELFLVFSGHGLVVVWLQAAVNEGKQVKGGVSHLFDRKKKSVVERCWTAQGNYTVA